MIPVILCGGSGTRLWPVSREAYPKPFIRFGDGPSLLQSTVARSAGLSDNAVFLITNESYGFKCREECAAVGAANDKQVVQILEPSGRNTAPAVTLAALAAQDLADDPTLLVLPADHLIPDVAAFHDAALRAEKLAADGDLVLFGITPTGPETGFGYVELGESIAQGASRVTQFVEKPSLKRAKTFIESNNFVWNSGMFCFKASSILRAMDEHAPDVLYAARQVWTSGRLASPVPDPDQLQFDPQAFDEMPDVSIDYAVMESAQNVSIVLADFRWSDIGSWKAVSEQLPDDSKGNTTIGDCVMIDSSNTHVQSEGRIVATIGVDNLVVIDTPDAILVANKNAGQQVKDVVAQLKSRGHETAREHKTVARPWGAYTVLHEGSRFKMKEIVVKPGQTLSLQMHHHRAEHWIVISGTAQVSCDEQTRMVYANESTFIPIGSTHRLENPGRVDCVLIEVQCGDYVGEDDIVRFEDRYGRVNTSVAG